MDGADQVHSRRHPAEHRKAVALAERVCGTVGIQNRMTAQGDEELSPGLAFAARQRHGAVVVRQAGDDGALVRDRRGFIGPLEAEAGLQQTRYPARIQRHGNKLKDAWADARALGLDLSNLILTPQDFDWMIEAFADHHQALTFRYMPDVKPFVRRITPGDMVKASQALAGTVLKHVPFPEGDVDAVA